MKAFETVGHRCIMSKCIGCELEKSTGRQNIKPGELPAALPLFSTLAKARGFFCATGYSWA